MEKPVIGFTGHANAGKTTLIRTLTKTKFGVTRDEANTTTETEPIDFEALFATFVDCPGLQNAGKYTQFLRYSKFLPPEERQEEDEFKFETLVDETLPKMDAVLYVVNLEKVPDTSDKDEIEFIKSRQPNVIAIINKYGTQVKDKGLENADKRVSLWTNMLRDQGIEKVIRFDAYWDSPKQVEEIYDSLYKILSGKKQEAYAAQLEQFKMNQRKIKLDAMEKVAACVLKCKAIRVSRKSSEDAKDVDKTKSRNASNLASQVEKNLIHFSKDMEEFYKLATQDPSISSDDFSYSESSESLTRGAVSQSALILGGTGGGGLAGAIAGFFIAGPVGALAGAVIGANAGQMAGMVAAGQQVDTREKGELSEDDIEQVADLCIGTLWAVSYQGFGVDEGDENNEITHLRVKELSRRIQSIKEKHKFPLSKAYRSEMSLQELGSDTRSDEKKIIDWGLSVLAELESLPQLGIIS